MVVLTKLNQVLHDNNPFVQQFKHCKEIIGPEQGMRIVGHPALDIRRYNTPTKDEVAVLIVDGEDANRNRDVILRKRNGQLQRISDCSSAYNPLSYPLFFPRGEAGWYDGIRYANEDARTKLSKMDWVRYYLQQRVGI